MVKPVSTFVSASSFSKPSSLRTFLPILGSMGIDSRRCCMPDAELSARVDQPSLLHKGSVEFSHEPLGCGSSSECTLNLRLLLLLRLLGSKVLCVETEFRLESCGCVSPLKQPFKKGCSPFLMPTPGFGWTYETGKEEPMKYDFSLPSLQKHHVSCPPSAVPNYSRLSVEPF
jgi:hypothetical protein